MGNNDKCFTLEVVTPRGLAVRVCCDSAQLMQADGKDGRGRGCVGIRKGHAPAVFLLDEGVITAALEGKQILSLPTGAGFAAVEGDTLTVTVCRADLPG